MDGDKIPRYHPNSRICGHSAAHNASLASAATLFHGKSSKAKGSLLICEPAFSR